MLLHLGKNIVVYKKDIIAILDAKSILNSKISREFIRTCEVEEIVSGIKNNKLRSFVIVEAVKNKTEHKTKIYCSPISALTLQKRANFIK